MKFLHQKESGSTLTSLMIAVGISGLFAITVSSGIKVYQKQNDYVKNLPVMTRYSAQLLSGAKQLLLDTTNPNTKKRTEGICQLVNTKALSPGVGLIEISLFPRKGSGSKKARPFTKDRWESSFENWKVGNVSAKGCKTTDNWTQCFVPNIDTNRQEMSRKQFKKLNITGVIKIKPIVTVPHKQNFFKPLKLSKQFSSDIKNIGFQIVSEVHFNRYNESKSKRYTKKLSHYIWAPLAGVCDYKIKQNKREVVLSLSGGGASNPNGNSIYNRARFGQSAVLPPIKSSFRRSQATEGVLGADGFIQTKTSANVAVSCNERRYQCPQKGGAGRTYAGMNMIANLVYNPVNSVSNKNGKGMASEMTMKPSIIIKKQGGNNIASSSTAVFQIPGLAKLGGNKFKVNSQHTMLISLQDLPNSNTANSICQQVCTAPSYNKYALGSVKAYEPFLKFKFDESPDNFHQSAGENVSCISCYMKSCSQLGLGTFGLMEKQPYQPLDAGMPECWAEENLNNINKDPYKNAGAFTYDSTGTGSCVVGSIIPGQDKFKLERSACSGASNLPVMCFNYGKFLLGKKLSGTSWELHKTTNISNAADICFNMGREVVDTATLDGLFQAGSLNSLPKAGDNYDFVNLALQGIFIAPQIQDDAEAYREWMQKEGISPNQKFWVALKPVAGNKLEAMIPSLPSATSGAQHAIYSNTNGILEHKKMNFNLMGGSGIKSGAGARLLVHNLRYKGAVDAATSQNKAFRFLCKKKNKRYYFVTTADSKEYSDGTSTCGAEDGEFKRPRYPADWIIGFLEGQKNDRSYSFPHPNLDSPGELKPVWVKK